HPHPPSHTHLPTPTFPHTHPLARRPSTHTQSRYRQPGQRSQHPSQSTSCKSFTHPSSSYSSSSSSSSSSSYFNLYKVHRLPKSCPSPLFSQHSSYNHPQ